MSAQSVDALRDTLVAQGIDVSAPPRETLARDERDTVVDAPLPDKDEFEVIRELGRGGMGVVELAVQTALKREVAIKRLLEDDPADADALLR